jgi:hypothetical protein
LGGLEGDKERAVFCHGMSHIIGFDVHELLAYESNILLAPRLLCVLPRTPEIVSCLFGYAGGYYHELPHKLLLFQELKSWGTDEVRFGLMRVVKDQLSEKLLAFRARQEVQVFPWRDLLQLLPYPEENLLHIIQDVFPSDLKLSLPHDVPFFVAVICYSLDLHSFEAICYIRDNFQEAFARAFQDTMDRLDGNAAKIDILLKGVCKS